MSQFLPHDSINGKIYVITNNITGKCYVGQTTKSVKSRWWYHCRAMSGCTYLSKSIQKYGKENFTIMTVDTACSFDELNSKEMLYIKKFQSLAPLGYNLTSGGLNCKMTENTLKKMSNSKMGHFVSEETKKKISNSNLGKKHSEETKKKIAQSSLGKTHSEKAKNMIGLKNKGKKRTAETKLKIKLANQKKVICLETGNVFDSVILASQKMGISKQLIADVARGRYKKAKGLTFKYA